VRAVPIRERIARLPLAQRLATAKIGSLRQLATDRSRERDVPIKRMGFLAGRQDRERAAGKAWRLDLRWRMLPAYERHWLVAAGGAAGLMALIGRGLLSGAFRSPPGTN
jgi:hypothetical protein